MTEGLLHTLLKASLEEGRSYICRHLAEWNDHAAIAKLLTDEAFRQRAIDAMTSLKIAELLITFGELAHSPNAHARGLKAKGDVLHYIGHHRAALTCLDQAGKEFLKTGDELGWAHSRISWIPSCAWLGSVERALQEAARTREVFIHYGEDFWACAVDINTAVIYKQTGQYNRALDLYARALAIYPTLTNQSETYIQRAIAIIMNNQATNLSLLGNFAQAYHLLERSRASFCELNETSAIIHTEINIADLDYMQGYYGSALGRYYDARDSFSAHHLDDPYLLTEMMLRMAACLVKLNRAREACQLAGEAVEIFKRLDISLDTGEALREYATTLLAAGQTQEALAALEEATSVFKHGGFENQAGAASLQLAELLVKTAAISEAYTRSNEIKRYFDKQGLVARSTRAALVMAEALLKLAQQASEQQGIESLLAEAFAHCEWVAQASRQHNLQEQQYQSQHLLGRLYTMQHDNDRASLHYQSAVEQIEQMLEDLAYDLSSSFLHTTWMVYEETIALCLKQERYEHAFHYLERARSMALQQYLNTLQPAQEQEGLSSSIRRTQYELDLKEWQAKYRRYSAQLLDIHAVPGLAADQETIAAELRLCEAKLSELFDRLHLHPTRLPSTRLQDHPRLHTSSQPMCDIQHLRHYLSADQLLLTYFYAQDKLTVFACSQEQFATHELPGGAQLERLLSLTSAHLQPIAWRNPQQALHAIRGLLSKLYRLLIAPIENLLPAQTGTLTIVPYGPLHQLPFHALFDGDHYLIERFRVHYLPASNTLAHLTRPESPSAKAPASRQPLIFGYSGKGHLPHALDEANALHEILQGERYLEEEATIARLIERAPGSPLIHLASHGRSRLDAPNFSYVRLADGQLNALDAFRLDLRACELVTLSGCETGRALSGGGDEQLGLGRAFLAAGASSLVMSLWPVEDAATHTLMQSFYHYLLQGESKVQALQAAQCSLLSDPSHQHPYFWAAFRLVGDGGTLDYRNNMCRAD